MLGPRFQRTSQPQQAVVVNWANPLARGLVAASVAEGSPGDPAVYTNVNGYSIEHGRLGRYGRLTAASTQYWTLTGGRGFIAPSWPMTAVALVRPASLHNGAILTVRASASNYSELYCINTGTISLLVSGGGAASAASAYAAGEEFAVGARLSSDTSRDIWKNGSQIASSTVSRTAFTANENHWGVWGGTTDRFNGGMALRLAWTRALSDAEMASVTRNPWQLFAPTESRLWVPVAAGSTLPTLSAATFVNATSTSLTPRVTAQWT